MDEIEQKVSALDKLVTKTEEVNKDLSDLIDHLHQVGAPEGQPFLFTTSLSRTEHLLRWHLKNCDDVKYRHLKMGQSDALLVFIDQLADVPAMQESVIAPLLKQSDGLSMALLAETVLAAADVTILTQASDAVEAVLTGQTLFAVDGQAEVLVIDLKKMVKRSVSTPETETIIHGPHDAFTETLLDNIGLIRRRTRDSKLKVSIYKIGARTQTAVALIYIANLVKPGLVEAIEKKLRSIKIDKVLLSATIEELLSTNPWTPFPQMQSTERPETVVAAVYEGRVGIIVDNTPFAMLVPTTLPVLLHSTEDYTTPAVVTSLIRLTRFISASVAIFLPAIYTSIVSYHPGMLPTTLAIQIAELRARTPFPSILEAIMMEILLEIFQEAITRLPKKIAGAAGVVGALVIGTTVVEAGLVNALLVVVTAVTAIASFTMPSYNFAMALRFFRIPMLFLGAIFGLFGVTLGFIALVIHLCSLKSFGESYLGPLFDVSAMTDWKDTIIRVPTQYNKFRPKQFGPKDRVKGEQ